MSESYRHRADREDREIAERFRTIAGVYEGPGGCRLYERLVRAAADDPEILRLMRRAQPAQRQPMLLLAAVHDELLRNPDHPLAAYYESVTGKPGEGTDPYPAFTDFCRERSNELRSLIATRSVQTNETGRCAALLPCFAAVSDGSAPLSLIELGPSAGLNLGWDRYAYRYVAGDDDESALVAGDHGSAVQVSCRLRGHGVPPLPGRLPEVAWRVGIDVSPVNLEDPDDVRWLRACVWPHQRERAERLKRAIELSRAQPVRLIRGDALELVDEAIAQAPEGTTVCVFHSVLLAYFTDGQVNALRSILAERPNVAWIACEPPGVLAGQREKDHLAVTLGYGGDVRIVARAGFHGEWLEWVDGVE